MKQYVIDELRPGEHEKIKAYLDKNFGRSALDGMYWIPLDPEYLTQEQAEHESCRPHYFAAILERNHLSCEFLIRTQNRVRCNCMGYADEKQQARIIQFADSVFKALGIKI